MDSKVVGLESEYELISATIESGSDASEICCDKVLLSVGRQANTDDLGLEYTDVETDDTGCIVVDDRQRTSDRRIYAIGDAAGGMQLAHKAMYEGRVAAEVVAGKTSAFDARAIPAVVYTTPQVAWCGLTEDDARQEDRDIKAATFPWAASGRALSMDADEGLTKLVLDAENGRVLGMGAVGKHAESLIAEGVLAIEMGATTEDLALTIHAHPTLGETVGEAAELFLGQATHFAPKAKAPSK